MDYTWESPLPLSLAPSIGFLFKPNKRRNKKVTKRSTSQMFDHAQALRLTSPRTIAVVSMMFGDCSIDVVCCGGGGETLKREPGLEPLAAVTSLTAEEPTPLLEADSSRRGREG